jgi:transcriptional regulator with XRE-family HTH domain
MKLGDVLRKWRLMSELDLRTVAAEIGTDASTLIRIEQGRSPSAETLRNILIWLLYKESSNGTSKVR